MNINGQEVDINDLYDKKYMHKEIKKGIYLSEYQCEVLNRYGINPKECASINDIMFLIDEILEDDFVIGLLWEDETDEESEIRPPRVMVEHSSFGAELTPEEINILAILMMVNWVQRQVTSIEHTRMKYSGSDFKMTSQANHLQKLMSLLSECQRQSFHMQRLYKRRKLVEGKYESNWGVFHYKNYPYDN